MWFSTRTLVTPPLPTKKKRISPGILKTKDSISAWATDLLSQDKRSYVQVDKEHHALTGRRGEPDAQKKDPIKKVKTQPQTSSTKTTECNSTKTLKVQNNSEI